VKKTISKNKTNKILTKKSTSVASSKKIEVKTATKKQVGKKAK